MCGIAGMVYLDGREATPEDVANVERMTAMLTHRGPDQGAVWARGPAVLGNRRLAILDLSPAGALPMHSHDDRLHLAYNGEIYNHPALRHEMEMQGVRFHSDSDAETLLELYRRTTDTGRDLYEMLPRLRGMFAFALWDEKSKCLTVARDRFGEKPLFYYVDPEKVIFASEIKALLANNFVPRSSTFYQEQVVRYLQSGYLSHSSIHNSAFFNVNTLKPGEVFVWGHGWRYRSVDGEPELYANRRHSAAPRPYTPAEFSTAVEQVRAGLDEAVAQAMISDVPLGAFLSGGLDSSLIVACMKQHTNAPVKTFSIGFEGDTSFDETAYAEQVARALGTEHIAFRVQPNALDLLPTLVWHHDQPFADSSAIPTYLVSQLTRQHVTVALTGDGGDELFAGYERFYAASLVQRLGFIPRPLWKTASAALHLLPEETSYRGGVKRARRFADAASKPLGLAYQDWVSIFSEEQIAALAGRSPRTSANHVSSQTHAVEDLLDYNLHSYLPDDLLVKTDRSSMAVSLETRAPFLDPKLADLALSLPLNMKLHGKTTKHVLKEAARGMLPDVIIDRPKHGFGVPLGAWLRQDMSPVRDVLLSPEARGRGLLNMQAVEGLIREHEDGRRDHGQRLWALLTLEWWHRLFIDPVEIAAPTRPNLLANGHG